MSNQFIIFEKSVFDKNSFYVLYKTFFGIEVRESTQYHHLSEINKVIKQHARYTKDHAMLFEILFRTKKNKNLEKYFIGTIQKKGNRKLFFSSVNEHIHICNQFRDIIKIPENGKFVYLVPRKVL